MRKSRVPLLLAVVFLTLCLASCGDGSSKKIGRPLPQPEPPQQLFTNFVTDVINNPPADGQPVLFDCSTLLKDENLIPDGSLLCR